MMQSKAHERLDNDINNYGQTKAISRVIDGLRRLTNEYEGKPLEEIIVKIIKGDIFTYVYSSEYYPPYSKTSEVTWGLSFYIMSSCPSAHPLPTHKNGAYILVQPNNDQIIRELFFVSNGNKPDPIMKINIPQDALDLLISTLFPSVTNGVYENLPELNPHQVQQIKKITRHTLTLTEAPGMWKQHANWQALSPSDANIVLSNPKIKNVLCPGQQGFDIDDLWVVKHEADELVKHLIGSSSKPRTPQNTVVSKEVLYSSIKLSDERRLLLIKKIQEETPKSRKQRIKEDVDFYIEELQKLFPLNKIFRELTVRMVYSLDRPIYASLNKKQPESDSYVTYDREVRRQRRKEKKFA
jgi:hypothetical protein